MSSAVFDRLDHYLWKLTYKWAKHGHPNKSKQWVFYRYFGQFNRSRRDRWVFGDRETGAYLLRFGWTKIVRHQLVPGRASPDDPTLAAYSAKRRRRSSPPLDRVSLRLLQMQRGRCPACEGLLLLSDHEPQALPEWQRWLTVIREALRKQAVTAERVLGGSDEPAALRLIHAHCRQRPTLTVDLGPGSSTSASP